MRNFFNRLADGFRRFMMGRYGNDKLNMTLLVVALVVCFVNLFLPKSPAKLALVLVYYGILGYALFRTFSRNTYKRYQENRKYLQFVERLRDREHRYYDCPKCRQQVRVPKGKGKISITCPKCKEKFIKKT